jgi:CheY-like chemotaxis protein
VSHDLRTPMHGVLAAVAQLRDNPAPEVAAALYDTIERGTGELLENLDQLILLAQPPDLADLHPVAANVATILSTLRGTYEQVFPEDRPAVVVELDPSAGGEVLIQKAGFLRVLDALFAEFMQLADPGQLTVSISQGAEHLVLEIAGFSAPVAEGEWVLVEQAVKAIRGHVARPSPAEVTVTIPAIPITVTRHGRGSRVLLVDDTAVIRELGQAIVRSMGYEVDAADGGEAAIAAVAARDYGLVLMDIRMPDLDGLTATTRIRAGQAGPEAAQVPIVALTAHAIAGAREEALMAGMDDFVTKPFSRWTLAPVMYRFLSPPEETTTE